MKRKTLPETRKIQILKIIEEHLGIHHRELLRIINKKQLMAKATAEKYLNELVQENEILSHKYGKEKQYFLSASNSTEKQLDKQFDVRLKQLKKKINEIEANYKKYDYATKYGFIGYLDNLYDYLSGGLLNALRNADIERKAASLAYPRQIIKDIEQMLGKANTKSDHEVLHSAYERFDRLREVTSESSKYDNELKTHRVSQTRKELQQKIKQKMKQESALIFELEDIYNSLKSKNKS